VAEERERFGHTSEDVRCGGTVDAAAQQERFQLPSVREDVFDGLVVWREVAEEVDVSQVSDGENGRRESPALVSNGDSSKGLLILIDEIVYGVRIPAVRLVRKVREMFECEEKEICRTVG